MKISQDHEKAFNTVTTRMLDKQSPTSVVQIKRDKFTLIAFPTCNTG
jgi:hypothetical protein